MRVLLSGATSLPGLALLRLLLEAGHVVRCLVRPGSPNAGRLEGLAQVVRGDAGRVEDLLRALEGVDAVAHVAGIGYAPQVVEAMRRAGVERLLAVSSTSARSRYAFRSSPKLEMEEVVRGSGLEWTIVRPTMIYGSELDRNIHRLLRFLDRSPVFPVFGSGENLWQPVYYEDCARGAFEALVRPRATGQVYELPGARPLTYVERVRTAASALGRRVRIVRIPLEPARRALALTERLGLRLPVSSEQVLRLREDKAYPYEKARKELGYAPRPFEEGVALEVERLRELGMVRP